MYSAIMTPITTITEIGIGLKPKSPAKGVRGRQIVRPTISRVAVSRYFPGLLLKKGFLLRDYQHYQGCRNDGFHKPAGSELFCLALGGEEAKHRKSGSRIPNW